MAKKIYGFHFAGLWVDQRTRVVVSQEEGEGVYSPVAESPEGYLVPTEYAIASGPKEAKKMFFKYFDYVRKQVDPIHQLVLVCEPTIVEYTLEDALNTPCVRKQLAQCCMADYYGWTEETLAGELAKALQGKDKYEELF